MSLADTSIVRPQVIRNTYPVWDRAGNRLQLIHVRYACGHEDQWYSLDLGKGWKPRTKAQIMADELRITCPIGYRVCRKCSEQAS